MAALHLSHVFKKFLHLYHCSFDVVVQSSSEKLPLNNEDSSGFKQTKLNMQCLWRNKLKKKEQLESTTCYRLYPGTCIVLVQSLDRHLGLASQS